MYKMFQNFEILNSVSESMAIINREGAILFTNKTWNSFSTENNGNASCTGVNTNYFTVCDNATGQEAEMANTAKTGILRVVENAMNIFEMEYPCHSPNQNRWFILRANKIINHPQLTLLAHIDITNRKQAELQVENNYTQSVMINDRLHTTLYKIVHDIQNPLSGIIGLVGLTKSETDIQVLNEYLELIEEGSHDLSEFVKDTLRHLSTSENVESVDVQNVVSQYLNSIKHLALSKNINIVHTVDQNSEFYSNEIEFRSIFSNLVSNALKYSDDRKAEKTIQIHFSSDTDHGVLTVKDNGIGIKKEELSKIMKRNYQVDGHSKDGVGLGLHMVEKSLFSLGGSIEINSEFGVGTEFIVKIPNRL
ncbi:HAMP domain-containing histidine kinase [Gelidibacter gilvus]|uniref:histidine kinase n=2 Tax=Gelidibacter gilvus TaxID=59602 RepID=A0A4Q0XG56_9FLAO|nr:HAMP domain-containing histidine kinase [Gelidibacter gilvus]